MKIIKPQFLTLALSGAALSGALMLAPATLPAQDAPAADVAAPVAPAPKTATPPDPLPANHAPMSLVGKFAQDGQNAPNVGSIIAPAAQSRPLKVAIYDGPGAPKASIQSIVDRVAMIPGSTVTRLKPEEFATADLSQFDIVAFSGGGGSAQAKALGEAGREKVRAFVHDGGGYLGICAGAYLATSGYPWSLGILNAKTVSPKWMRGGAFLQMELSADGRKVFGDTKDRFFVRYHNGPIIKPDSKPDLPTYNVEAYFRTEVDLYQAPIGVQVDSPAVISAPYGKGRVLTISPHPENTKGLENFVPRGLVWLGDKSAPADAPAKK